MKRGMRMKVAFVTAQPPYPPNTGGRIRTFNLLREVSRIHDVTLLTACAAEEDREALAALRDILGGVAIKAVQVGRRTAPRERALRLMRALSGPLPYTWATYCTPQFRSHVRGALRESAYDLVHCDHSHVAYAFIGLESPPRVLNAHNIDSVLFRRMAEHEASPWKRGLMAWQTLKTVRAEAEVHRCFDRSIVVSEVDRVELDRISPGLMISIVPNGVDPRWFRPPCGLAPSPMMVFVGSMDWFPNIDGVSFFVRDVLPRIRREVPDATVWVVGRTPPSSQARAWTAAGVHVTGTVDDVRPFVARAWLVVVPLRIAGGTRLKILEAWAMGKAVLSTTVGAEGLPVRDGENIALANEPAYIASRAVALLTNPNDIARLGAAGRRVAEEQFTWSRIAKQLVQAYDDTVSCARRGITDAAPRSATAQAGVMVVSAGPDGRGV